MYTNRFGAYSSPTRSMDEFVSFISSKTALEETFEYLAAPEAIRATDDIMNGLDSWMSSEDRRIVDYYKTYVKGGGH
jgi:hypothetical protein